MRKMFWMCVVVFGILVGWTMGYAADFYVIPGMKKNFAPVPKTGQTKCYDEYGSKIVCSGTGQDGDHQNGVAWPDPRFKDNGNGTVTDKLTGLIWLRNSTDPGTKTWTKALETCNGLEDGSCGLTDDSVAGDWRLPNMRELYSLVDLSQCDPALPADSHFIGNFTDYYWSSSTCAFYPGSAWGVGFYDGLVSYDVKASNYYVRCVRSGR